MGVSFDRKKRCHVVPVHHELQKIETALITLIYVLHFVPRTEN